MCASDPADAWLRLCVVAANGARSTGPERECYLAHLDGRLAGFIISASKAPLPATSRPSASHRNFAAGLRLPDSSHSPKHRIFRDHRNVFLCVSSFNHAARKLYRQPRLRNRRRTEGLPGCRPLRVPAAQDARADSRVVTRDGAHACFHPAQARVNTWDLACPRTDPTAIPPMLGLRRCTIPIIPESPE